MACAMRALHQHSLHSPHSTTSRPRLLSQAQACRSISGSNFSKHDAYPTVSSHAQWSQSSSSSLARQLQHQSRQHSRNVMMHAGEGPTEPSDKAKGSGGVDWDGSWKRFVKEAASQVDRDPGSPTSKPRPSAGPPRRAQAPQVSPGSKLVRENEKLLLDFWVNENFFKVGAASAVLVLLFFLFFVGGPPTDDRCTLPWC